VDWPGFLASPSWSVSRTRTATSSPRTVPSARPPSSSSRRDRRELFSLWGHHAFDLGGHSVLVRSMDSRRPRGTDRQDVRDGADWPVIGPTDPVLSVNIPWGPRARGSISGIRGLGPRPCRLWSCVRTASPCPSSPGRVHHAGPGACPAAAGGRNVKQDGSQHYTSIQPRWIPFRQA